MDKRGQNEGLRVLDDFVCEAIPNPAVPQAVPDKRGQNEGMRVLEEVSLGLEPMDANQLLAEFRRALIGHAVRFSRLAANSLILYVDCQPGEEHGFAIWFEPTWHMSSPQGVLVGSRQAQAQGEGEATKEVLDHIGAPLTALNGLPITAIELDPRSNDLTLTIGGEYLVRTFVSDPTDDHIWHIRDDSKRLSVYASPCCLEVHESNGQSERTP